MELIDLMNSVIIFLCKMTLLRLLTFLLGSLNVILTVLLFWICFFLLMLVFVLQWLSLHWKILMLLSQFPWLLNKHKTGCPASSYTLTILMLIGMVFVIIWEMFHGWTFLNLVILLLLVNFVSGFKLELMYTSLI